MIELPEALTLAKQLNNSVVGKRVLRVLPPSKPHKFCWFSADAAEYNRCLTNSIINAAEGFGIFVELVFDNGQKLCFNDGVNVRLINAGKIPQNYQLVIEFDDETALCFTVAMYGGIILHACDYSNEYYLRSKAAVSPLAASFRDYYFNLLPSSKQSLSVKAFLATQQRFPGIGNGVLLDILFEARINPKRKLMLLTENEREKLCSAVICVLRKMTDLGGRDTQKDLFGNEGGYITQMSKNTLSCPVCSGKAVKETYLGGAVYYCPVCQKTEEK